MEFRTSRQNSCYKNIPLLRVKTSGVNSSHLYKKVSTCTNKHRFVVKSLYFYQNIPLCTRKDFFFDKTAHLEGQTVWVIIYIYKTARTYANFVIQKACNSTKGKKVPQWS